MGTIDLNKYEVKEIIRDQDDSSDEMIQYLLSIINDRSIPENQKQSVQEQFNEIMRLKNITMKPPTIVLIPNENGQ